MYDDLFAERLSYLRGQRGISARDMSLSIGQNPGYINNIESGKALPSMAAFFLICEFFHITPKEFFDFEMPNPNLLNEVVYDLSKLNANQLQHIGLVVKDLISE